MKSKRLLSALLRFLGIFGKFILLLFLIKKINPEDFGVYSIIAATVGYSIYLIGFDFYAYSIRYILQNKNINANNYIANQFAFYLITFAVSVPILYCGFYFELLPIKFFSVFIIILLLEFLLQESARMMVAFGYPLLSSFVAFVRGGAWCYFFVFVSYFFDINNNYVKNLFITWIAFDVLAFIFVVFKFYNTFDVSNFHIEKKWVYNGLLVSKNIMVGTLAIRALFVLDRYFVGNISGEKFLGVYSVYVGIGSSIVALVEAGIISFKYPDFVKNYKIADFKQKIVIYRNFCHSILYPLGIILVVALLSGYYLFEYMDKSEYKAHYKIYVAVIVSYGVYIVGLIPHYKLYSAGQDGLNLISNVVGLALFLICAMLGKYLSYGDQVVPASLFIGFFGIFLLKYIFTKISV